MKIKKQHLFKIVRLSHNSWSEGYKKTLESSSRDRLSNHLEYTLENLKEVETLYFKFEKHCDVSLVNSDKHRFNVDKCMMIPDHLYKQYKEDSGTFFDYDDLISRGEIKIFSKSELEQYLQNLKRENNILYYYIDYP